MRGFLLGFRDQASSVVTASSAIAPRLQISNLKVDKIPDQHSHLIGSRVQREMTGIMNVDLSVRQSLR